MTHFNTIILGGGAAGLMCAATAGQRGKSVLVLDHADEVGKKILISGGGRCNFTNLNVLPKCYLSQNPHFAKSALSRYTQQDFIALVARYGIAYHEKTLGQLFCDGSARAIVKMLLEECAKGGVDVRTGHSISDIAHADGMFRVSTNHGVFTAQNLVLATGGPAIPKMGATGFAYDVARQFRHKIIEPKPALVPLKTPQEQLSFVQNLAGIAVEAVVSMNPLSHNGRGCPNKMRAGEGENIDRFISHPHPSLPSVVPPSPIMGEGKMRKNPSPTFRENILFTHRGFSGPAILQISSYWMDLPKSRSDLHEQGEARSEGGRGGVSPHTITLNMLPDTDLMAFFKDRKQTRPKAELKTILAEVLPARLAQAIAEDYPSAPIATFPDKTLAAIASHIQAYPFTPSGSEGFAKAEVTLGGIDTAGLSSQTMESRTVKGLYAIGEAVDVTGWLGGYNFQWAWSSGWVAGMSV